MGAEVDDDWKKDAGEKATRIWEFWKPIVKDDSDFPCFSLALRLIVLIQVSSCSVERVFSQMKLVVETCGPVYEDTLESLSKIKDLAIQKVDTSSSTKISATPDFNIVFGLSGNHSGFLAEFKVALKSVFINAPIDHGMNIHVIGDEEAYNSLAQIFNETQYSLGKGLGQMHFNGQEGRRKEAYFMSHGFVLFDKFNKTSGLSKYYVSLPWNWAKYMVESKDSTSRPPFQVRLIEHHDKNLNLFEATSYSLLDI
ncbi:hypothetical protein CTEN210_13234 [Chaetoceros tenuissimus]|uniref:HAT C-terminal dimerisation domain-containing protein n=1 Tax=Chaetoceros tenuissimus TaxID=426638 RepID=A0AAD3D302_9STRA|nr:hypothetical protein CTEN210_13234 [Chaetoceros tenuissimus]